MQKKSIIALAVTASITTMPVQGLELGEAISIMKKLSSKQPVIANRPVNPNAVDPNDRNQSIALTSEQFCEALSKNEQAISFANALEKAANANHKRPNQASMDSSDYIVTKWVKQKIDNLSTRDDHKPFEYANRCAYQLKDSTLLYLFGWPDEIKKRIAEYERDIANPKRTVNSRGEVVEVKQTEFLPGFIDFYPSRIDSEQAQVLAFAFPEGPEMLKKYASDSTAILEAETAKYVAEQAEMKKRDDFANLQKQQEEAKQRLAAAKQEKLNNSPEGLLQRGYAAYQTVEKCYQVRDGYQVIYISDPELAAAKLQVKQIEAKLKPQIKASTDTVWTNATNANLRTEYPFLGGLSFDHAKQVCTFNRSELEGIANQVAGTSKPRKSF